MAKKNIFKKLFSLFRKDKATLDKSQISRVLQGNRHYNREYYENKNVYIDTENGYRIPDISIFYDISESDYQFRTALQQVNSRIKSFPIKLNLATSHKNKKNKVKRLNYYIQRQLKQLFGYNEHTNEMQRGQYFLDYCLSANIVGKAIMSIDFKTKNENSFDLDTGYFEVENINLLDPLHFDFTYPDKDLVYFKDRFSEPIFCNPYQFLVHQNSRADMNPHGYSDIGIAGYHLYQATRFLMNDWLNSSKRHGDPPIDVTVDRVERGSGNYEEPSSNLLHAHLQTASAILNGKSFAHSDRVSFEYMKDELGNFDYQSAIELIDRAKSKLILNSTTTTENSENTGSMALGVVHNESLNAVVYEKINDIENTFNNLIYKLLDLNGFIEDGIELPSVYIDHREHNINTEKVDTIIEYMNKGIPLKLSDVYNSVFLDIPEGIDPNISTVGYYIKNSTGKSIYKEGLNDILNINVVEELKSNLEEENNNDNSENI